MPLFAVSLPLMVVVVIVIEAFDTAIFSFDPTLKRMLPEPLASASEVMKVSELFESEPAEPISAEPIELPSGKISNPDEIRMLPDESIVYCGVVPMPSLPCIMALPVARKLPFTDIDEEVMFAQFVAPTVKSILAPDGAFMSSAVAEWSA